MRYNDRITDNRTSRMLDWINKLTAFWTSISEPAQAAIFSALLAALRLAYYNDRRAWRKHGFEIGLCLALTLMAGKSLPAIGINEAAAWLIGAVLGFKGVEWVRARAEHWAENWLKDKTDGDDS